MRRCAQELQFNSARPGRIPTPYVTSEMQVGVAPPQPPSDFAVGKETLNMSPGKTVRVSPAVDVEAHAPQQTAICKRHRICELRGYSRIRKDPVKSRPTGNPILQGVEKHWQVLIEEARKLVPSRFINGMPCCRREVRRRMW